MNNNHLSRQKDNAINNIEQTVRDLVSEIEELEETIDKKDREIIKFKDQIHQLKR